MTETSLKDASLFVKPPLNLGPAHVERVEKLKENLFGRVNITRGAARALVMDKSIDRLAVGRDGDGFAAHGISVGLSAHELRRDCNNVLGVVLTTIIEATRAQAESEVGNVAEA